MPNRQALDLLAASVASMWHGTRSVMPASVMAQAAQEFGYTTEVWNVGSFIAGPRGVRHFGVAGFDLLRQMAESHTDGPVEVVTSTGQRPQRDPHLGDGADLVAYVKDIETVYDFTYARFATAQRMAVMDGISPTIRSWAVEVEGATIAYARVPLPKKSAAELRKLTRGDAAELAKEVAHRV